MDLMGDISSNFLVNHQFTPKNELLITVGENLDHETLLQNTEITSFLDKRMIVVQSREW